MLLSEAKAHFVGTFTLVKTIEKMKSHKLFMFDLYLLFCNFATLLEVTCYMSQVTIETRSTSKMPGNLFRFQIIFKTFEVSDKIIQY